MTEASAAKSQLTWTAYVTLLVPREKIPADVVQAVTSLLSPSSIEWSRDDSWGFEELEAVDGCEHFRPLVPLLMARDLPFNLSDEGAHRVAGRHIWWEPGMRFPVVEIQRSW